MLIINNKTNEVLELVYDMEPINSPLDDYGNIGKLCLSDGSYLDHYHKDGNNGVGPIDALSNVLGIDAWKVHDRQHNAYDFFEDIKAIGRKKRILIEPVSIYQHSEYNFYIGSDTGWDVSTNGFIYAKYNEIMQMHRTDAKHITKSDLLWAKKAFEDELKQYTDFINGYVYQVNYYADANNLDKQTDSICNIMASNLSESSDYAGKKEIKELVDIASCNFSIDKKSSNWQLARTIIHRSAIVAS